MSASTITNAIDLRKSILQLEAKQKQELQLIKIDLEELMENLKPVNLVKQTLEDVIASKEIQADVIDLSLGTISGMLIKKMIVGKSNNTILNFTGKVVENFVSQKIIKERNTIHFLGSKFMSMFASKIEKTEDNNENQNL